METPQSNDKTSSNLRKAIDNGWEQKVWEASLGYEAGSRMSTEEKIAELDRELAAYRRRLIDNDWTWKNPKNDKQMNTDGALITPTSTGEYAALRHEALYNGGSYMITTNPIRIKDLFQMIYQLHTKWGCDIEVHFSSLFVGKIIEMILQLGPTFKLLEIKITVKEVKDLIPWQVFILPPGKPAPGTIAEGCIALIDPVDVSVYKTPEHSGACINGDPGPLNILPGYECDTCENKRRNKK